MAESRASELLAAAAVAGGSHPVVASAAGFYSVPSRLIGHTVEARQHPSTVEVIYGGRVLCTMPGLRDTRRVSRQWHRCLHSIASLPLGLQESQPILARVY